jgi:hypothetical protein
MGKFITCTLRQKKKKLMTKPSRMRWAGYAALIEEKRNACSVLVGKPEERDHSEDLNIGGRVILK